MRSHLRSEAQAIQSGFHVGEERHDVVSVVMRRRIMQLEIRQRYKEKIGGGRSRDGRAATRATRGGVRMHVLPRSEAVSMECMPTCQALHQCITSTWHHPMVWRRHIALHNVVMVT